MAFLEMYLAEKPQSGDSNEAQHKYNLRTDGNESDSQVYSWLTQDQAASSTTVPVERPDGTTVTTGVPIPVVHDNLALANIRYQKDKDNAPELWRITAIYRNESGGGSGSPRTDTGASPILSFGFEYAPENITYRQSLETVTTYGVPFGPTSQIDAPDLGQAINVQPDGTIQGTQVPDPGTIETLTYTGFPSFFTNDRRTSIANARGKVNSTAFTASGLSFPAGSVRFLGASGQISTTGESSVDFRFGIRENVTGLQVDGLKTTGPSHIEYDGWDYFWVFYGKGVDSNGRPTSKPRGGYVERLFLRTDLNALFT